MKHLKKFESSTPDSFLKMRGEVLDLCYELIDNGIRVEILPGPGTKENVLLQVNLDLDLGQWGRGYQDVTLPEGDFSNTIKFFDFYRDRFNFVYNEVSQIMKRLESSGYKISLITPFHVRRNDYFEIIIMKDDGTKPSPLLKRRNTNETS